MTEKKETLNIDELTPVEKFFAKQIVEIKALASLNKGTLQQTLDMQKDIITNQNAEMETLKKQNQELLDIIQKQQVMQLKMREELQQVCLQIAHLHEHIAMFLNPKDIASWFDFEHYRYDSTGRKTNDFNQLMHSQDREIKSLENFHKKKRACMTKQQQETYKEL